MIRACFVALLAFGTFLSWTEEASARPRRRASSGYSSVPAGGDTSSAQGVAEIMARVGYVGHFGGNSGYEGCGSGGSPDQALSNCCYSNSGMAVTDQGVAYGHGRYWACKRYR